MAKEFFVRDWIRPRILLYAFSHMLVMPLVALWTASMSSAEAARSMTVWVFAALAFLGGLAFEVARKIRSPKDEHPMADSYTQSLGVSHASTLLTAVVFGAALVATALMRMTTGAFPVYLVVALVVCVAFASIVVSRFRKSQTSGDAKRSEMAAGIAALATQVVVIVAVITARGLT
jgi:4-hydroxybenzoate polyprenyltransferase